jgi:radical SAM protein with 4Fe4S-binding SPASM domain
MEFRDFCAIVDEAKGVKELHLQGLGEPMMHPRFFDMVRYAVSKNLHVTTNTNATLITEQRATECLSSGLHEIHISLDGATTQTYEYIRVASYFDRVLRNVRRLIQKKENTNQQVPHIQVVMVIMQRNLHELKEMVELVSSLGISNLFVQHLCHDFGESTLPEKYINMRKFVANETLLSVEEGRINRLFDEARNVAKARGVQLRLPHVRPKIHPPGTPPQTRCDWPWRGTYITYGGQVMPCCMVSTPDRMNFGSIHGVPFNEIWNSPAYRDFRERFDSANPPEICKTCSVYQGIF